MQEIAIRRSTVKYLVFVAWIMAVILELPGMGWAQQPGGVKPLQPPKPPEGVQALRDLEYVPNGHERQKLDLYLPEKAEGPLPVIVWIHGGAWRAGSKNYCPAVPYSAKGFAVAGINYRYRAGGFSGPD